MARERNGTSGQKIDRQAMAKVGDIFTAVKSLAEPKDYSKGYPAHPETKHINTKGGARLKGSD